MQMTNPDPVHLQRVNPGLNMARFYRLSVQPTLFGEASLLRCWGRIGTHGQAMMETFADPQVAASALMRLAAQKRRRGYQVST